MSARKHGLGGGGVDPAEVSAASAWTIPEVTPSSRGDRRGDRAAGSPLEVGGAPCGETPKEGLTSGRLLMPSREDGVGRSASEAGPSPAAAGEARAERSAQLQGPRIPLQHPPAPPARARAGKEAA